MKSLYYSLIFFILLFGIATCKPETLLDVRAIIEFVDTTTTTVLANNSAMASLRAKIPFDAIATKRSVIFTTDLGTFTNETVTITIEANSGGYAETFLKSNREGRATVVATVDGIKASKQVNFTALDLASAIRFDDLPASPLIADNLSEYRISSHIDTSIGMNKRTVTFTTDLGTFTNNQKSIIILANDGYAETLLKSDTPGQATVHASWDTFLVDAVLKFEAPDPDNIVQFTDLTTITLPGDGVSSATIEASINPLVPAADRTVTFTTDLGSLSAIADVKEYKADADANGVASVTIRSNQEGIARVSIKHKNVVRDRDIQFSLAYPDDISLQSPFTIEAGISKKTTITTILHRVIGQPGNGFHINYVATDSNHVIIGQFKNNNISTSDKKATVEYSAGNTAYRGLITIQGNLVENPSKTATEKITVVDPEP